MMLLSRTNIESCVHKWVAKLKIIPTRGKVARAKNSIAEIWRKTSAAETGGTKE
jgi:hypothetical protein